jgi:hypothetical protein
MTTRGRREFARELTRKYVAVPRQAPRSDDVFITTNDVDLDGDRVFPEGLDLSAYLANPVVRYLHDGYGRTESAGIPLGTTRSLEVVPGKGIKATGIDWLTGDPFVDRVKNAWDQGKLRGASIGFIPEDGKPNQHGGFDITKGKLLEWSIVPLPANTAAVRARDGRELAMAIKSLGLDPELVEPLGLGPIRDVATDIQGAFAEAIREYDQRTFANEILRAFRETK